jgi:hypothetical protein
VNAPPHLEHEWATLTEAEQTDVFRWAAELVGPTLMQEVAPRIAEAAVDQALNVLDGTMRTLTTVGALTPRGLAAWAAARAEWNTAPKETHP